MAKHPGTHNYPSKKAKKLAYSSSHTPWNDEPGCDNIAAYQQQSSASPHSFPTETPHPSSMPPSTSAPHTNVPNGNYHNQYSPYTSSSMLSDSPENKTSIPKKAVQWWGKTITADGADKSGLTGVIYTTIVNTASDSGMLLPLANILLFTATAQDSKMNVAIYLLVTLAPYAVIAPLLGPLLDKIHTGHRLALSVSFMIRTILACMLIYYCQFHDGKEYFSPWILYPCTLMMMLCSKTYSILKASIIPRVVPPTLDLVQVNSRVNTFAAVVGTTILGGGISTLCEFVLSKYCHIPGGFLWMAILTCAGAVMCLRLSPQVEGTQEEIPISLSQRLSPADIPGAHALHRNPYPPYDNVSEEHEETAPLRRHTITQPLGNKVLTCIWGVSTLKIAIGFLYLFMIFYSRSPIAVDTSLMDKLALAASGPGATALGGFIGNIIGAKIRLGTPEKIVVTCSVLGFISFLITSLLLWYRPHMLLYVVIAALVTAMSTNAGKVALDSSINHNLTHNAQASAFGLSESLLQIGWVVGAALGALLPPVPVLAYSVITAILFATTIQTFLVFHHKSAFNPVKKCAKMLYDKIMRKI